MRGLERFLAPGELEAIVRGRLETVLAACAGDVSEAAHRLAVPSRTLYRVLRRLQIPTGGKGRPPAASVPEIVTG